jgi:hypothetical protein
MAIGFVSIAFFDERLDHCDHFGDMIGGTRLNVGWQNAKCGHVFVISRLETLGDFSDGFSSFDRSGIYLVVDIREIAGESQLITAAQNARQQIEHDSRPRVTNMRIVVNRRATEVHRYLPFFERLEGNFFALLRVVQVNCHVRSYGGPALRRVCRRLTAAG